MTLERLLALLALASTAALPYGLVCSCSSPSAMGPARDAGTRRDASKVARDSAPPHDADAGPPALTELTVTGTAAGDASHAISLFPPFSPDIHDYYVRCGEGGNTLTVVMTARAGSKSLLIQPTRSPSLPSQILSLTVYENQAIVAAATNGTDATDYWVRCLPHDFPPFRMSFHTEAGAPTPGYYLVSAPGPGYLRNYAIVMDSHGVPVWYYLVTDAGISDVDTIVPGTISFTSRASVEVHELRPLGIESAAPSGTVLDPHEFRLLPNGHYLVLSDPVKNGVDLTGIVLELADGGVDTFGPDSSIQDCNVVEFDPSTGTVAWTWVGSEHLDAVKDSTVPSFASFGAVGPDGGPVVDSFHCNSIDVEPETGNLLVSARNMDSVFYIERKTGTIKWKMGGSAYTKDGASYVLATDPFYRQHDARLQPGWSPACGGSGRISVFDDHSLMPGTARGVVYDVVVGEADGGAGCDGGAAGTAQVAWQFEGKVDSVIMGSMRISADGSRVIGWGQGAPNLVFTEVDVAGHDLLDFEFEDNNSSYRAIKVPLTALDLDAMRSSAGLP